MLQLSTNILCKLIWYVVTTSIKYSTITLDSHQVLQYEHTNVGVHFQYYSACTWFFTMHSNVWKCSHKHLLQHRFHSHLQFAMDIVICCWQESSLWKTNNCIDKVVLLPNELTGLSPSMTQISRYNVGKQLNINEPCQFRQPMAQPIPGSNLHLTDYSNWTSSVSIIITALKPTSIMPWMTSLIHITGWSSQMWWYTNQQIDQFKSRNTKTF